MLGNQRGDLLAQPAFDAEGAFDQRSRRAGAHHAGLSFVAEQQRNAIDDDALAGAGLASQHIQPGRKLKVERIDDRKVSHAQFSQHTRI